MSVEKFSNLMNGNTSQQICIDTNRIKELTEKSKQLGITKMSYEHAGQAAWRYRWDNVPNHLMKTVASMDLFNS